MAEPPEVLSHLGQYTKHPPVAAFCEISRKCYLAYHAKTDSRDQSKETGRQHAVVRMMYIAESTSTVVRLSASWALSMPAMSLVRDRYEQAVRFSWLARQTDHLEWVKYLASLYAKRSKVHWALTERQRTELEKIIGKPEPWLTEKPTREQREFLDGWESLSLEAMAQKRDKLEPLGTTRLDRTTLGDLYNSIYRQMSSVTHYDFYGLSMLGLYQAPTG